LIWAGGVVRHHDKTFKGVDTTGCEISHHLVHCCFAVQKGRPLEHSECEVWRHDLGLDHLVILKNNFWCCLSENEVDLNVGSEMDIVDNRVVEISEVNDFEVLYSGVSEEDSEE
jgi:hypothetical protein